MGSVGWGCTEPVVWATLGTTCGRCHNWVGIPGRPPYVIPCGSAGWKKTYIEASRTEARHAINCSIERMSGEGVEERQTFIAIILNVIAIRPAWTFWEIWKTQQQGCTSIQVIKCPSRRKVSNRWRANTFIVIVQSRWSDPSSRSSCGSQEEKNQKHQEIPRLTSVSHGSD